MGLKRVCEVVHRLCGHIDGVRNEAGSFEEFRRCAGLDCLRQRQASSLEG